jgi:hypothetical protein
MQTSTPRYSAEEFATRGEAIFARDIEPHVRSENPRDFVLIDIESGDYEVDADDDAASDRLLARRPDAQVWMRRVGSPYGYYFGFRPLRQTS